MLDTDTKQKLYLRAAYLVEEFGWTKGNSGWNEGGPYCIQGAIGAAAKEMGLMSGWIVHPHVKTISFIDEHLPEMSESWRWNDEYERTQKEVVDRLLEMAGVEGAKEEVTERMLLNVG